MAALEKLVHTAASSFSARMAFFLLLRILTKAYSNMSRRLGRKVVQKPLPAASAWGVTGAAIEARLS